MFKPISHVWSGVGPPPKNENRLFTLLVGGGTNADPLLDPLIDLAAAGSMLVADSHDENKVVSETAVVTDPDAIKAALKPYLGGLQSKGGPMDHTQTAPLLRYP